MAKKRRRKIVKRSRTSSADIRFTFVLLVVGALLLLLGSVFVSQVREAAWTGAAVSGAVALVLVAASVYSIFQRRRD